MVSIALGNLTKPPWCSNQPFDRLVFKLMTGLGDGRVHLLHGISKFDTETAENITLPGVILRVHTGLHLLIIDDANSEGLLNF